MRRDSSSELRRDSTELRRDDLMIMLSRLPLITVRVRVRVS